MGWFKIPMSLFTMLVGNIAIGLAVDDTIHFMHNFRRYFEETKDAKFAVMETLHTAGRAMLVTSCVLSIGFFIFMFASMNNLFHFGLLTGFTIVMALLADFFIAPALMVVINRRKTFDRITG
jgi:predicted RND superfamily exporter protein